MTRKEQTATVIGYWLEKAEAALASARDEHTAGRKDFAVNRAYYAAFYAASAALLAAGKRFIKHSGLRSAVHRELVMTGRLSAEWGRGFDRLFEGRQRADYLELVRFEADEVDGLIDDATGFVAEMRRLVAEYGESSA